MDEAKFGPDVLVFFFEHHLSYCLMFSSQCYTYILFCWSFDVACFRLARM
jgi:hypothetical protein